MAERFRCLRCGACCRSLSPLVVLSDVELWVRKGAWHIVETIEAVEASGILKSLGLERCFIIRRRNGACLFYRRGECSIYDLRPAVCRLFPLAYSKTGVTVHPWASSNCPSVKLYGPPSPTEELDRLARKIVRELIGLPFYTSLIEGLISSTGRAVQRGSLRIDVETV